MKTNKFILALMGATLLSANALASGVVYDENGFSTDVSQPYQAPSANTDGAFEIANAGNLYWFAEYVSQGGDNAKANAVLTKDIVVNENVLDNEGNLNGTPARIWTPIGTFEKHYCGNFDGQGYTISGLYFNEPNESFYVGLFGEIDNATIKNIGVIDSYIKAGQYMAGVCAYNFQGIIANCYNAGVVSSRIEDSDYIGGVCGYNFQGTITNCYNTGSVISGGEGCKKIGGVCGGNENGTIINSYNTGSVSGEENSMLVGGVCGGNENGTITNCYNTGRVSGGEFFGGVCGFNSGTITTCYYLNSSADQGVGEGNAEGVTSASTDEFADGTIAQFLRDYDNDKEDAEKIGSDVWGQYVDVDGVPTFRGYVKFNPTQITEGDYTGYYALANADDLYWFANFVNQGGDNVFAKAILTKDIVVNENVLDNEGNLNGTPARIWTPIGTTEFPYSGNFDGNGHTVSGLYFNDDMSNGKYVGLFGNVYGTWESGELIKKAVIKNVGIVDSYINAHDCIGGICGQAYNVEIINCYNTCNLYGHGNIYSGFDDLGGICGKAQNVNIVNCYNMGKTIGSSYHVGGICGSAYDNVNIINCYNIDKVFSGRGYVGGILGYGSNSAIINCYNIGSIEDLNNYSHGGICGDESDNITNCYYLASSEKTDGARTSAQFADGTVATALHNYDNGETGDANINGAIWGQTVGQDASPNFSKKILVVAIDETNFPDANFRQFVLDEIDADEDGTLSKEEIEATVEISCGGKEIESLKGIEYFTALKSLACGNNKITELDLSANTAVTTFVLSNNVLDKEIVESTGFVMPNVVFENVSNVTGATIEKDETTGGTKFIPSSLSTTEISYTYDVANSNVENPTFKMTFLQLQVVAYDVDGDGTIGANEQAFAISTDDELYLFANYVNKGDDNAKANAVLTKDIIVNEDVLSSLVFDEESGKETNAGGFREWFPIGYCYDRDDDGEDENVGFKGIFDGDGHTISGLYFNNEDQTSVGLIGVMSQTGIVKNVGIIDSYFYGNKYVGAICGDNYSNKEITNCYNTGSVNAINHHVGGICGENNEDCIISNCYNVGSVSGTSYYDGICGEYDNSTVKNCYDFKVNGGTISNEYSIEIKDEKIVLPQISRNSDPFFGWYSNSGFTGDAVTSESKFDGVHTFYARWTVTLHASIEKYGSLVTFDVETEPNITVSTFLNLVGSQVGSGYRHSDMLLFYNGTQLSYDAKLGNTVQNGTTFTFELKSKYNKNGFQDGSFLPYKKPSLKNGVYQIANAGNLYWFAEFVNQGGDNVFAKAILTKDIVINENVLDNEGNLNGTPARTWTPIGTEDFSYRGVFDGNGHTISGLYVDNEDANYVGLFGKMGDLSLVKKLGIVDSYLKGNKYVGSICGYAFDAKIDSCYSAGVVKGHEYVGGLFGEVSCNFDNYDGDKNMNNMYVTNCHNEGSVEGDGNYIGGIAGKVGSRMENCYNVGTVVGIGEVGGTGGFIYLNGLVKECYNKGEIKGEYRVGGLTGGMLPHTSIINCYNSGKVECVSVGAGLCCINEGLIVNSYANGAVTSGEGASGICVENNGTIVNCYYDNTKFTGNAVLADNGTSTVYGNTSAQFADGTVASALHDYDNDETGDANINGAIWGQTVGQDASPNFSKKILVVAIDETNFPDANFRQYVLDEIDADEDGTLSKEEIEATVEISCSGKEIESLKGIEYFTALESLECGNNKITELDLSANTAVATLVLSNNELDKGLVDPTGFVMPNVVFENVSNVTGATIEKDETTGGTKFIPSSALITEISYTYDVANSNVENPTFKMAISVFESIAIDETNFPDENFRQYILDVIDTNDDEILNLSEFVATKQIDCSNRGIASLQGIEYFTGITELICNDNKLTSVDLSHNTALQSFNCYFNKITSLDVSANTELTKLVCDYNSLSSLDLSKNTNLEYLECSANKIESLDLSNNANLLYFSSYGNRLKSLDLSKNAKLNHLSCDYNQLASLTVSPEADYSYYSCAGNINEALGFDAEGGIVMPNVVFEKVLSCSENVVATKDEATGGTRFTVVDNTTDEFTYTYDMENSSIAPEDYPIFTIVLPVDDALYVAIDETIFPDPNFRQEITSGKDLNGDGKLSPYEIKMATELVLENKNISSIQGVDLFTNLFYLNCSDNNLTSVDLSNNTKLNSILVDNNQLESIDVSHNTALVELSVEGNLLTSIDLSQNSNLHNLNLSNNHLTDLDLSNNKLLLGVGVKCEGNTFDMGAIPMDGFVMPNVDVLNVWATAGANPDEDITTGGTLFMPWMENSTSVSYQYYTGNDGVDPVIFTISFVVGKKLELSVNDEDFGEVAGAGIFAMDSTVEISATPNAGYHFVNWSNGSTKIKDSIHVVSDTALVATFEAHLFGNWDTTLVATCAVAGLRTHACACGEVEIDTIAALGHKVVTDSAVAATCTATGLTEGKHCSVCDSVLVAQQIVAKIAHTVVVDSAKTATCTATGLTEGSHCSVCNSILVAQQTVAKIAHTVVVDSAKTATCSATGLTEGSHCSVCNSILVAQQTVAKIAHTVVVDSAKTATCSATGLTEGSHCSVCNEVIKAQDAIPALGHKVVVDSAVVATCTATGLTEGKHCSVCDSVLVAQQTIPALGHSFTNYIYNNDATTEADGTETAVCDHGCGATDTRTAEGTKLTDIDATETAEVVIYAHHNVIVVENADADIYVYDATGRCIEMRESCPSVEIAMQREGIYIVRTGDKVQRVAVK